MQIVIASATRNEVAIVAGMLANAGKTQHKHHTELLITGIGGVPAAYALTRRICLSRPDLIIQAGLAGSFTDAFQPGSVAFVAEEVFADLGAEEGGVIADMFDLGLVGDTEFPFKNRMLVNPDNSRWEHFGLAFARAATVNRISSSSKDVALLTSKYSPDLESMEGAALHYVCLLENIPFIQLRAVSNFAGERNKRNWKLMEAIERLNETLKNILQQL